MTTRKHAANPMDSPPTADELTEAAWRSRIYEGVRRTVARLDAITTALASQSTALGDLAAQQQQLADQIAALVAGQVTQEEIDAVAATAQANADAIAAASTAADALIEPDAGEGEPPPVEEPPVEEPPVEPVP